jgi:DNA-directed RNA polymerase subunit RPC12/RpoP
MPRSNDQDESGHICVDCGKIFKFKRVLEKHRYSCDEDETSDSGYNCPDCGKQFDDKESIKQHIEVYCDMEAESIFTCSNCGKEFEFEREMKNHSFNCL